MKGFIELKLMFDEVNNIATINVNTIAYFYPRDSRTMIILTTSEGLKEAHTPFAYAEVRKMIEEAMK